MARVRDVESPFGKMKRVRSDSVRYLHLIKDWSASGEGYTVIHELDGVDGRASAGANPEGRDQGNAIP